ncbi:hypothetical protein DRV85_17365 [Rhodosalinus halophilus]|uniref:Uncharacterized protein n=1 Tax=Rhodosalinus halophilus TaxID=2259333 RepID=A0A365U6J7_9RHOB|nr:hypothetical protein [Rhodosalinus halophilus]RBI82941.1 hypothetical protein DRV85_17365 [Rhodosalinus halophilus]
MRIVLHAGSLATDEDRLIKTLLRNIDHLAPRGVAVPGPSRYRQLLRDTLVSMRRADPAPDAREVLLDTMLDRAPEEVERLILSNERFFAAPQQAFAGGVLFPQAEERLANMRRLFPDDGLELYLAVRNPATFLPAVLSSLKGATLEEMMQGLPPSEMRWSNLVARLRDGVPDVPITLWCYEDSPILWGTILREMAGLEQGTKIAGAFDLLGEIMSAEGMQRFRAYLAKHPELTEPLKMRVMAAFLDKFALDEMVEEELDIPGWTEETVTAMTDAYEADVAAIAEMEGVRLLSAEG